MVFALHWHESAMGVRPAVPLLGIHSEESRTERDTHTPVFIAALFTIAMLFFSVPAARTPSPWRFRLPALTIPPGVNFFFFFFLPLSQPLWVMLLSRVWLLVTPCTVARQAPLSMGFSRQEYWSGLPFPSPGDFPDPGIKPRSPALQADALPSEPLLPCYHKHSLPAPKIDLTEGKADLKSGPRLTMWRAWSSGWLLSCIQGKVPHQIEKQGAVHGT